MSGVLGMKARKPSTIPATASADDDLLATMDNRAAIVRTVKARAAELHADLGGFDNLSHAQKSIIARLASLETVIADKEARLLTDSNVRDDDEYLRSFLQCLGVLINLYRTIGIKRVAKDAKGLQDVLRGSRS